MIFDEHSHNICPFCCRKSFHLFPGLAAAAAGVTALFVSLLLFSPSPALSYSVSYLNGFGSYGREKGNLSGPEALAFDAQGDIYVADTRNSRVQVFSPEGVFLRGWGNEGRGQAALDSPSGIAVGRDRVYVADAEDDRIGVFDKKGNYIDSFGKSGDDPKEFDEPRGLALWNGFLYVADSGNDRVQVLTEDGIFLYQISAKKSRYSTLREPYAVSVDNTGHLYVLDKGNGLTVINPNGMVSSSNMTIGYDMPSASALWVNAGGIYMATKDRVYKYDFALRKVFSFGSSGGGPGSFRSISSLTVDSAGNLYVLDKEKNSVQKFLAETPSSGEVPPAIPSSVAYVGELPYPPAGILPGESGRFFIPDEQAQRLGRLQGEGRGKTAGNVLSAAPEEKDAHIWTVDREEDCLREYDGTGKLIRRVGRKGEGAEQFYDPSALVLHGGYIYVADSGNARIQVLDTSGKFIRTFGRQGKGRGEFENPVALDIGKGDTLYVLDEDLDRVVRTDREGNFLSEFGSEGDADGQLDAPRGIAVIGGEVYVLDSGNNRVQVFSADGEYLRKFGSEGRGKGEFREPSAMFVDTNYNLFISDKRNDRIEVFKLLLTPSSPKVLRADGMIKEIKVTWQPAPEPYVGSYRVFRRPTGGQGFHEIGRVAAKSSFHKYAYFDKNLKSDTAFDYAVTASSRSGNMSTLSNVVNARTKKLVPSTPRLDKVEAGQRDLLIKWIPSPEAYVDHYVVMRNNETWHSFTEIGKTAKCSFKDSNLSPNTLYKYRIIAVGTEGDRSAPLDMETRTGKLPAIEITGVETEDIFASNYKYYEVNPLGRISLQNNSDNAITNIRVSLLVSGYMDYPTEEVVDRMEGGSRKEVSLRAIFNNKVLDLTENSSLQSKIRVSYFEGKEEKSFEVSHPLKVFEKHALVWDRTGKAALFVTPKDPALMDFATQATSGYRGMLNSGLLKARDVFDALGINGITYMEDPNNPYQTVSRDASSIDYVQYPRETLRRKAGDCDDLVVLYSSLLEGLGVNTAFVVYPGHIFLLASSGVDSADGDEFGFPRDDYVIFDDEIWVPVEVTLVGNSFTEAWKKGLDEFSQWKDKGLQIVRISDAWRNFKPASLDYEDWKPEMVTSAQIDARFPGELKGIEERKANYMNSLFYRTPDTSYSLGRLGILYARNGMYQQALKVFTKYMGINGENAAVLNNMGNVYFLQGKYKMAERTYLRALRYDLQDAGIMVNFARCYDKMGKKEKARKYFRKALEIDPEVSHKYSYGPSD